MNIELCINEESYIFRSNKFKEENQMTASSTSFQDDTSRGVVISPTMNRKGIPKGRNSQGKSSKKKEKLYCICQTAYDDSRFV